MGLKTDYHILIWNFEQWFTIIVTSDLVLLNAFFHISWGNWEFGYKDIENFQQS